MVNKYSFIERRFLRPLFIVLKFFGYCPVNKFFIQFCFAAMLFRSFLKTNLFLLLLRKKQIAKRASNFKLSKLPRPPYYLSKICNILFSLIVLIFSEISKSKLDFLNICFFCNFLFRAYCIFLLSLFFQNQIFNSSFQPFWLRSMFFYLKISFPEKKEEFGKRWGLATFYLIILLNYIEGFYGFSFQYGGFRIQSREYLQSFILEIGLI